MAKKLNISFKDNEMDMKLYIEIIKHTDKSAFVKEAIQFYINSILVAATRPSNSTLSAQSSNYNNNVKETNEILNILG